jgi:hypothetical protein
MQDKGVAQNSRYLAAPVMVASLRELLSRACTLMTLASDFAEL